MFGLLVSARRVIDAATGEKQYLESARTIADESIAKLATNGLFRGHHAKPFYEAIDGVGHLLDGLLQLHQE